MEYLDFLFLDGWDWDRVQKTTTLRPGRTYKHSDLRFEYRSFPLFISARFSGALSAKYAKLHLSFDEKVLSESPYNVSTKIGQISGTNYFEVPIYDETNNIFLITYIPKKPLFAKKELEIYVSYPEVVGGTVLTDTINVAITGLIIKITDEEAFLRSLKKFEER